MKNFKFLLPLLLVIGLASCGKDEGGSSDVNSCEADAWAGTYSLTTSSSSCALFPIGDGDVTIKAVDGALSIDLVETNDSYTINGCEINESFKYGEYDVVVYIKKEGKVVTVNASTEALGTQIICERVYTRK